MSLCRVKRVCLHTPSVVPGGMTVTTAGSSCDGRTILNFANKTTAAQAQSRPGC